MIRAALGRLAAAVRTALHAPNGAAAAPPGPARVLVTSPLGGEWQWGRDAEGQAVIPLGLDVVEDDVLGGVISGDGAMVEVLAPAAGRCLSVCIADGAPVAIGDVLLEVEPR